MWYLVEMESCSQAASCGRKTNKNKVRSASRGSFSFNCTQAAPPDVVVYRLE